MTLDDPVSLVPQSLPNNIEAEQALIGLVLIDNATLSRVGALEPPHFYEDLHARIYESCVEIHAAGGKVDPVIIKTRFANDQAMEEAGGTNYLGRLAAAATVIQNAPDYAKSIIESWRRREILLASRTAVVACGEGEDPEVIADVLMEQITSLDGLEKRGAEHASLPMERVMNRLEKGRSPVMPTGFTDLDRIIGGLSGGQLIIMAGRPGMGKSALAHQMGATFAKKGEGVALFTPEMTAEEVTERILSHELNLAGHPVPYRDMKQRDLSDHMETLIRAGIVIENMPLYIADDGLQGLPWITARAKAVKAHLERLGTPLGAIFIDYLQLLESSHRYGGNRNNEVGEITATLKRLAKSLSVPVICLCQLNRGVEQRENKRPLLSDLRDSGSIEQDADIVLMLFRKEYYLERERPERHNTEARDRWHQELMASRNRLEIIVQKNRGGPTGTAALYADMANNTFADLERRSDQ